MARGQRVNTRTVNGAEFVKNNAANFANCADFTKALAIELADAGYAYPGNGPRNDAKAAWGAIRSDPWQITPEWKKILGGEDTTESVGSAPKANPPAVVQKVGAKQPTYEDLLTRYKSNAGNLANLRSRLVEMEKQVEQDKSALVAARSVAVEANKAATSAEEAHKAIVDRNAKAREALINAGMEDAAKAIVDPPAPTIVRVTIPDLPF